MAGRRVVCKGHKHARLKEEREADIEQKMKGMDAEIRAYRRGRREKRSEARAAAETFGS